MDTYSKKILRRKMLAKRDLLSPSERRRKDAIIRHTLFSTPVFKEANTVFFYASFRTESETISMIKETLKMGKRVVVPKVDREMRRLRLYEIKDINELSPGYAGIPEPSLSDERLRNIEDIDIVIIPGVVFDYSGNRIGYGGGYYDRVLSEMRKKLPFIALAYKEQLVDLIPAEEHDVKVDMIITDEGIVKIPKPKDDA
ncbi:MAG: 5-formyltetrahydrofolate cyclo-ligase [Nitrospira sp.]|nr:5-formyltetrahydrofolate cyclo-ligase [Nitrospira sp.]